MAYFTCQRISPQPISCWGLFPVPEKPERIQLVDMGVMRGAYESVFILEDQSRIISSIPVLQCKDMNVRLEHDEDVLRAHGFDPMTIEIIDASIGIE
jgi:hypothetical protein